MPMETADMLTSRVLYVIMKSQLAGNMMFDGHAPSAEEKKNAEESRLLCDRIERQLLSCKMSKIPLLLNGYELLFMVGNRRKPNRDFLERYKHRVIDAWKHGDKTIEESDVFGLIVPEAAYHPETAPSEYVKLYLTIKDRWIDTLLKFNRFPDATTKENYERIAFIMRENLDKHFGVDSLKMKRKWYIANKVDKSSGISSAILCSYQRFVTALYPDVLTYNEMLALDTIVLKDLIGRSDLDPYIREAYRLSLSFNTEQVN